MIANKRVIDVIFLWKEYQEDFKSFNIEYEDLRNLEELTYKEFLELLEIDINYTDGWMLKASFLKFITDIQNHKNYNNIASHILKQMDKEE